MAELADELGVPYKTLERWRSVYRRDRSMPPGKPPVAKASPASSRERELQRRLAYVERERDILKKALAIFSRDPGLRNDSK
jgi:transposase